MQITTLLSSIAALALLLATGFVTGKTEITDRVSTERLSTFIVKVGQPFLAINALISQPFTKENLATGLKILILGLCMHVGMALLAFAFSRPIKDIDEKKLSEFSVVFTNCGFIGFPIIESIYGADGLFYGAFYIIANHIFVWSWGVAILARGRKDIKITPKKILLNYGTLPSAIGFALFCMNLPMPAFVTDWIRYIYGVCTPIAIIISGANLSRRNLAAALRNKNIYYMGLVKLIIMPLAVTTVLWLLGLPEYIIVFGGVMAAMPSAAVITMFGEMYGISPGYASELVGMSTLFSVFTIAPMVIYAQWLSSIPLW